MVKKMVIQSLLLGSALFGSYVYATATDNTVDEKNQANTFSQMESLDQSIEAAGREITALKMNNELKELQSQAEQMKTSFVVIRIYGLENRLKASLRFKNNSVADVQEGDIVESHYRVTRITQTQVTLYDEASGKTINAPFAESANTKASEIKNHEN